MKTVKLISRIIVGLVFIFSGFVKGIDPLGSTYKFNDYFQAFHLGFLKDFSLPLALILCAAEFIVGFSLVTGYKLKFGIRGAVFFMLIFTPLTFVLALSNPVSDCGCFGDAVQLSNWQTFYKNLIISIFAIILYSDIKKEPEPINPKSGWYVLAITCIAFLLFSCYNYKHLPIIDFLPYRIGTSISEKMTIPEGALPTEYSTTFFYEKNGTQKEFTLANYPVNDTTWKFVSQKTKIIKKGYEPPIHDFNIVSSEGNEITDIILNDPGYSVFMVTKKLSEASEVDLQKGFGLGSYCTANNIKFYVLTASTHDEASGFDNGSQFCFGDETTLKTMVRANPGFILLKNGTITGKWAAADLPENTWFAGDMSGKQLDNYARRSELLLVATISVSMIVILILLCILLNKKVERIQNNN
jgi:uncharacterized membrane protein YphA (DoxX/SURF4 family)